MQEFLATHIQWIKVLHLTFVIAWFAGMMYLPRLFVYHHQAEPGGEAAQFFTLMERRLMKGIINPSMIAVWVLGVILMFANPVAAMSVWLHIKLVLVLAISGIHGFYSTSMKKFAAGEKPRTQKFWRIMNEVPFILLILVLILALVKPFM
jgi:putative membrane protein